MQRPHASAIAMKSVTCVRVAAVLALAWLVAGCQSTAEDAEAVAFATGYATAIESAHGMDAWLGHEALQTRIEVTFGDQTMLTGTLLMETDSARSRIETDDGAVMVFDGETAWVAPAEAEAPMARFHLLTWSYFIAAPFKLRDRGSHLVRVGERSVNEELHLAARLTFDPGIGDTPDDWYVTYLHPATDRLAALAYIVTYGTPTAEAEKEPHAMTYEDFDNVEGVTIGRRWRFWHWSETAGIYGDPMGAVVLSDLQFVTPATDAFQAPAGARMDELPQP